MWCYLSSSSSSFSFIFDWAINEINIFMYYDRSFANPTILIVLYLNDNVFKQGRMITRNKNRNK